MVDLLVVRKGGIQSSVDAAIAAQKGAASGVAPLDAASKVPAANSRVESVAGRQGAITLGVADVSGAVAKAGDTMTGALVLAADPVSALQPVTKQMLDALLSSLDAKPDVRLASNNNHALTGSQTVDGVAVVTGDRILLKNQTAGAENGVWVASTTGAWVRATDADTATKIKDMYTFVAEGSTNKDTGWLLTTDAITLGTTALVYGQFSGPGSTLAGTGLTRSGNTISASFGAAAGTVTEGNDARLRTIRDEGVALTNRAILDFLGTGVIVEDDPITGRTKVTISGAAAGAASEAAAGITQWATAQQIIDGADGNFFATPARLKAYIDSRLTPEAWIAPALTNGWVNFGVPYGTAAFRKEPYGLVRLRGVVKSGTTGTATPIFTLPVGYRPAAGAMNPGENNGPYQTVDVQPDGKVSVYGAASNVRVSLDAVVFAV